jgi:AraC-like DNA-binding protein
MMTDESVRDVNGRIVSIEDVIPGLSACLKTIKNHSRPDNEIIADICRRITSGADRRRFPDERFRGMIDDLRRGDIPRNVDDLCARSGYSKRMLERLFHAFIGNTPKEYLRKERFGRIMRIMGSGMRKSLLSDLNLTNLAYDFEFCDQSHMIREFKKFSGVTPSAYRAADYVKALCGQM